jgi:hypothetical protein
MAYMVPSQIVYKSPHSLGSQAKCTCLTKVNLRNLKNYIKLTFQWQEVGHYFEATNAVCLGTAYDVLLSNKSHTKEHRIVLCTQELKKFNTG